MSDRAKCPGCGRVFRVRPYAGTDGSVDHFPRHTTDKSHYWVPRGDGYEVTSPMACNRSRSNVDRADYLPEDTPTGGTQ